MDRLANLEPFSCIFLLAFDPIGLSATAVTGCSPHVQRDIPSIA
jgi:hypothetical protein